MFGALATICLVVAVTLLWLDICEMEKMMENLEERMDKLEGK